MVPQERQAVRDFIQQAKAGAVCQRCGASERIDFHHPDPDTKLFNIGEAANGNYTLEQVQAEIAKCVPMCKSCHGRLSSNQGLEARLDTLDRRRHRVELGSEVYWDLEREARWLGVPINTLASMLIRDSIQRLHQQDSPAARIVAEGSPSPTLSLLQRQAGQRLAAAEDDSEHA